jgi:hypothetical protein
MAKTKKSHGGARNNAGLKQHHIRGKFLTNRDKEVIEARDKWKKTEREAKEIKKETKDLYRGEYYPEGAPLRAVGF